MDTSLYSMIFKRKSFHLFHNLGEEKLTREDLADIYRVWETLTPLCPQIRTAIRIVRAKETTNQHGQEYCVAFYSEKKEHFLQNIGYLGQQLDLYLVSKNIATCWYGIGRAREGSLDGLEYVIMIAIRKVSDPGKFRQDLKKVKRKSLEETWQGEILPGVSDVARFAPSACNSQPWRVERQGNTLEIFRYKKPGMVGIMNGESANYMNRIDMGIYLCILQLCLAYQGIFHTVELCPDPTWDTPTSLTAKVELFCDKG